MSQTASTSSVLSWPKTTSDQDALDGADKAKFGRVVTDIRPGFLVRIRGPVRGGSVGREVIARALNVRCASAAAGDDAVLCSTVEYGRLWFRCRGSAFRCLGRAPE